jgi:putative membrane protein
MKPLTEELKGQIKEAILHAEQNSSCEFVTIITQKSGNYQIYALFVATLGALLLPHLLFWMNEGMGSVFLFQLQIIMLIIFMVLAQLPFFITHLVPSRVKRHHASLVAHQSFHKFGLYRTKKRRAILFFVSIDERYAHILTDIGIDAHINPVVWHTIIDDFRRTITTKTVAQGYLEAINACGEILAREFPRQADDSDELPNDLMIDTQI